MKRLFMPAALFALFFSSCESGGETPEPPDPPEQQGVVVAMMTYNIYGARANTETPPTDLNKIARVINANSPDFVALQEVDVFTNRTGKEVHQARDLARLTGMYWYFTKAIDRDGGEYGDAVLSKYPLLETQRYLLPVSPELSGEFRSVAVVKVKVGDVVFSVASTHLDHLQPEGNRILQANKLKEVVAGIDGPLILGGDFNARPESETIAIVKSYLTTGCRGNCEFTFPSDVPDRTIDYIMYKPIDKISVQAYRVIRETEASDHRPVMAVLRVK